MTIGFGILAQQGGNEPRTPRINLRQIRQQPHAGPTTSSAAQGGLEPKTVTVAPAAGSATIKQSTDETKTPGVDNTHLIQGNREPATPDVSARGAKPDGEGGKTHPAPEEPATPNGQKENRASAGETEPEPPPQPPPTNDSCSCRSVGNAPSRTVTGFMAIVRSVWKELLPSR